MRNNKLVSNRKNDTKQEKVLNDYLFKNYFKPLNPTSQLVFDKDLQIAGVDVEITTKNGVKKYIDIKAQSSKKYVNNPKPTYILELSSLNRHGDDFVGWFLNEELITDYYTFVWIPKAKVNEKLEIVSPDDIEEVEVMTVNKSALKKYILSILGDRNIQDIVAQMRKNELTRLPLTNGIHFSHTPTLFEKPVNLVVKKHILKKFAINHYYIKQGKLIKI